MKHCPDCGKKLNDKARFCPQCGNELPAAPPSSPSADQLASTQSDLNNRQQPTPAPQNNNQRIMAISAVTVIILFAAFTVANLLNKKQPSVPGYETSIQYDTPAASLTTAPTVAVTTAVEATGTVESPAKVITQEDATQQQTTYALLNESIDLIGYTRAGIHSAHQSSELGKNSDGSPNNAYMALDADDSTCWQEGVSGAGIGQSMEAVLDRRYQISYLSFKLGNWLNDKYYYGNNVPSALTIRLGNSILQIDFPAERREFVVQISPAIETDYIHIQIDDVYYGTSWDDTCITDIGIYE